MMVAGDRVARQPAPRGAVTAAGGSQPEQAFARALREKGCTAEDADAGADGDSNASGDSDGDGSGQAPAQGCPTMALAAPSRAAGCQDGVSAGGGDAPALGIEATGASAAAKAVDSMLAPTAADADSTAWEASVSDGRGFAIALRAEPAPPGPGEQAAWSVTIASPALASEVLERNAPRLTNRLRRRGIGSRVRIEEALEDAGQEST
jgi:hypothetical protein